MKTLKFLGQNAVYAVLGAFLSIMLKFYETPETGIVEAVLMQALRNYVIIFIFITAGRLVAPMLKKMTLKWDRKKAERYEKILIIGFYVGLFVLAWLLIKSLSGSDAGTTPVFHAIFLR